MVEIRQLGLDELERLRELDVSETGEIVYKWIDGAVVATPETWKRPRWDEAECRRRVGLLRQRLEDGNVIIGAFDDSVLVALAVLQPELSPGTSCLVGLWVSRSHRRRGLASRLCEECEKLARAAGAGKMFVSACPSASAVGFYRSRGFRPARDVSPEWSRREPEDIQMLKGL